jgi:hypothetical protein
MCLVGIVVVCGLVVMAPTAPAEAATDCTATLCVLAPTALDALDIKQGTLRVTGSILVNSTNSEAAKIGTDAVATATGTIGGPAAPAGFVRGGTAAFSPTPTNQPAGTDPFAALAQCPSATACPATPATPYPNVTVTNTTQTINPGVYRNITVSAGGRLTLNPGTYVVTTAFSATGASTQVTGTGVTIYLACSTYPTPCATPTAGASYTASVTSTVTLNAPTSGAYAGLSVFSDRKNTATIGTGTNATTTAGGVYAVAGALIVTGSTVTLTRAVVGLVGVVNNNGISGLLSIAPAGALSITVPATASLGSIAPGGTLSGALGAVTVSDGRGLPTASWTATVSTTTFTTGGATTAETIAKSVVSYWSGPATSTAGAGTFTPGQLTAANAQALSVTRTAFTLSGGTGNTSATWNPTLVIHVPAQAVGGTYTGTVTHSVA